MGQQALYPIVYDAKHYAVMANDVIRGKQEMTLQEARILRLVITQVAREDKDLKTYSCNIGDLAEFLRIPPNDLYRDIKDITTNLLRRIVIVGTGNPRHPWKAFNWLQMAAYDGAGTVRLMLSEQIREFVLELDKYFTTYRLENILEMNSFYAIRLYELLKCDDYQDGGEHREYGVAFLRGFFGCENKYTLFADFKKRVLETAVKEINAKSDLEVLGVAYRRKERRVDSVAFHVGDNFAVLRGRGEPDYTFS